MQKEVDGDVARSRKNVKDARKSAIRRVKMATDTILEKIEAMAEEAVAQAMKKRKLVYISFGLVCRAVEFLCPVPRERMANALVGASMHANYVLRIRVLM